ncbi:GGDEF domain-containing protein [Thalassotalea sp. LPB0316]|uniref:GGDEF domain-containing protein n=1 Tax=Thalassotalea sp. LPB0316 TaxID=2769490 RepID=UPI001866DC60|nr:GGDEF domain-containing protein [Thalassotalea sp. LPB0316]QOL26825.1 GGDEF domain-containing protein [Thalassotalea sp. LPB0316]
MKYLPILFTVFSLLTWRLVAASPWVFEQAQTVEQVADANPLLDSRVTFTLRDEIRLLFTGDDTSKASMSDIEALLRQPDLNNAEYYLLYLSQAVALTEQQLFEQAHQVFETAIDYETRISEAQLALPLFNQLYLLQSQLYEQQENFKLAYDKRDIYFDRMIEHHQSLNKERIESLKEKYQTEIKENNNELLKNQNELKQLQLQKLVQKDTQQQYLTLAVLIVIIVFIVLIIRQIQIRKKLTSYSRTDALTGLSNRKVLFEQGREMVEQVHADQGALSVLLFDLDYFKKINDEFGHQAGDEVLTTVATLAKETVRSRDLLVRFGGEEFVAILPDASIEQAKAMAERLREKISQTTFASPLEQVKITTSVGVAALGQAMNLDQLIHNADIAMYQAKLQGRDRVLIHHPEMEHKPANYRRNS